MYLIVAVILFLLLIGLLPHWGYWGGSAPMGYYPSGGIGTLLVILLFLFLFGYLH
jgi:hypothetical protein